MAYGMLGHMAISVQESFNTATNSWEYFPIVSENLTTNIEQLIEEDMRARKDEPPTQEGLITVAGDIVFEPHPIPVGHFLRGVVGAASVSYSDSIAAGGLATWTFTPPQTDFTAGVCALPPFTFEVHRNTTNSWEFRDAQVNQLTFEVAGGAITKCTASVIARVSSLMTKTTPTFDTDKPWTWKGTTVTIGGASNTELLDATITLNNNLEGITVLDGNQYQGKYLHSTYRNLGDVSGTMCFLNETEYGIFRAQTEQAWVITMTSDQNISANSVASLSFSMPTMRYTSYPVNMGGPGLITAGFEATAKYDTSNNYTAQVTLVNTRETYTT
jgi:hypothetical protein